MTKALGYIEVRSSRPRFCPTNQAHREKKGVHGWHKTGNDKRIRYHPTTCAVADPETSMTILDRLFSALLLLGSAAHAVGTFVFYTWPSEIFVWSLGTGLAGLLIGRINLLRVNRLNDNPLAWTCAVGALAWLGIVLAFGVVEGDVFDPRVVMHAVGAIGATAMSLRAIMRAA
jgi:hypothetical protein